MHPRQTPAPPPSPPRPSRPRGAAAGARQARGPGQPQQSARAGAGGRSAPAASPLELVLLPARSSPPSPGSSPAFIGAPWGGQGRDPRHLRIGESLFPTKDLYDHRVQASAQRHPSVPRCHGRMFSQRLQGWGPQHLSGQAAPGLGKAAAIAPGVPGSPRCRSRRLPRRAGASRHLPSP